MWSTHAPLLSHASHLGIINCPHRTNSGATPATQSSSGSGNNSWRQAQGCTASGEAPAEASHPATEAPYRSTCKVQCRLTAMHPIVAYSSAKRFPCSVPAHCDSHCPRANTLQSTDARPEDRPELHSSPKARPLSPPCLSQASITANHSAVKLFVRHPHESQQYAPYCSLLHLSASTQGILVMPTEIATYAEISR